MGNIIVKVKEKNGALDSHLAAEWMNIMWWRRSNPDLSGPPPAGIGPPDFDPDDPHIPIVLWPGDTLEWDVASFTGAKQALLKVSLQCVTNARTKNSNEAGHGHPFVGDPNWPGNSRTGAPFRGQIDPNPNAADRARFNSHRFFAYTIEDTDPNNPWLPHDPHIIWHDPR